MQPAQRGNCLPEVPGLPVFRRCGVDSDTPELRAAEQVMDVHRICCADHTVQCQGAVGEGALEDAHLP